MKFISSLGDGDILQHVEQSHPLWGDDQSVSERFEKLRKRLQRFGPDHLTMSGWVDSNGTLLSSLKRYYLKLSIHGKPRQTIGLGAIFTHPSYRESGLAQKLIREVLDASRKNQGCETALLFSDIGVDYYHRFGFREAPATFWQIPIEKIERKVEPLFYRLATSEDQDLLLSLQDQCSADRPLKTSRSEKNWALFQEINNVEKMVILIDKEPVGLISFLLHKKGTAGGIGEAVIFDGYRDRFWPTLRKLCEEFEITEVRGWSDPEMPLPTDAEIQPRKRAVPMVAVLDPHIKISSQDLVDSYFSVTDHF